ncbi:unnamed protein product [Caenorhabditis bovis]|uniref:Uncharacterized protein n=1 Tax=Caenorhabditis bovis TaxID=2654633 RepID=A0A8S1EGG1_9PELO|nr:unnamed protein product [Caenorhabditis bovis]
MVRTYAFNASMQSEQREIQRNAFNAFRSQISHNYGPSDPPQESYKPEKPPYQHSNSVNSEPVQEMSGSNQPMAPLPVSDLQFSPFHSPYIDPVGSIVGLRLLYIDGKLAYVPVEPQINMMINQQFGPLLGRPPLNHTDIFYSRENLSKINNNNTLSPQSVPQKNISNYNTVNMSSNVQNTVDRRNSDYTTLKQGNNMNYSPAPMKPYGSMPNLAQRQPLSTQEQHKLELQMQIEENKRRKELERQKELELEQREIRKWEEYQARLRREEELEKEKLREKARAAERRSQKIYEEQLEQQRYAKQHQQPRNSYRTKEPSREISRREPSPPHHESYREYSYDYENRPPSRNERYSKPARRRQDSVETQVIRSDRSERPDSSQPRAVEWWEKKPSWQERTESRRSAVIPTLRGKPPAAPSSSGSRRGYDPSASVQDHQSRAASRSTSRSSTPFDTSLQQELESPPSNSERSAPKKPTAFTISA